MPFPPSANDPIVPDKMVIKSYPSPELSDRIYVVHVDSRKGGYVLPEKGKPYEGRDAERYEGFAFATAVPSDQVGWVDHYYVNARANQDAYNFEMEYPWVSKDYPRVTRSYLIPRQDYKAPDAHTLDPIFEELLLVSEVETRTGDAVTDSLFVGVKRVFERIPAPIEFSNERFESVLPYKFRTGLPGMTTVKIEEGPAQMPSLGKGDWAASETTNSAFRKTVKRLTRDLPLGGLTFVGKKLTRDKQVALVTETWREGDQDIDARPTLLEADVDQMGDGTSIKSETEVPDIFPARKFSAEIPDPVPSEFRSLSPTRTFAESSAGQAQPPTLGVGEIAVSEDQTDEEIKRRQVTNRDPQDFPATLVDFELGGIDTHGSEFGGVLSNTKTLDSKEQKIEEGFDIIKSEVKHIGAGLNIRQTKRIYGTGVYLELIDGGDSYVDDPAVIFTAGERGGGGVATSSISKIFPGIGELDSGIFTLTKVSDGDDQGIFTFLGKRYHNGVWKNPSLAGGVVTVTAKDKAQHEVGYYRQVLDHDYSSFVSITPFKGGGNALIFDFGAGRKVKPTYVNLRGPDETTASANNATKYEVFGKNPEDAAFTKIATSSELPTTPVWRGRAITTPKAYRYLSIVASDLVYIDPPVNLIYQVMGLAEVEFYGELTIQPAVDLSYSYNGDVGGAFYYLGKRGGGGTWRNPQTAGDITISTPYDALALGTFDSIVDRQPSNTYLVDRDHSELWFDLGEGRELLLKSVTFQQRSDYGSTMVDCAIQGIEDGGGQFEFFKPSSRAAEWTKFNTPSFTKPYRKFRLIIPIGKNVLACGELELYGILSLASVGGYGVTGITLINGGSGYAEAPIVQLTGDGVGAAAHAVIESGAIKQVVLDSPGSGYTVAPSVGFVIPGQVTAVAKATAQLTAANSFGGGGVGSITLIDQGSGYVTPPFVKIVSSSGSGAAATAGVSNGNVTNINVTNQGSGYLLPPTVVLVGPNDPDADAEIGYGIDAVTLTNRGSGYTSPPSVRVVGDNATIHGTAKLGFGVQEVLLSNGGDGYASAPTVAINGDGTGATATAILGRNVASVNVTNSGSGYTEPPEVRASSGSAQFTAVLGRALSRIEVLNFGGGYAAAPPVTINGDGTGATAHSILGRAVATIPVAGGGTGYVTAPAVTISAPTGILMKVWATAHAVLTGGVVTSIVIDTAGMGYLSEPTVTIEAGPGTAATAGAPTLAATGQLDSIVLDTYGSGYSTTSIAIAGATAFGVINPVGIGSVKRIEVLNPGADYTTAPALNIPDGDSGGTGAAATAILSADGRVVAVSVTNAGGLYTVAAVIFTGGSPTTSAFGTATFLPSGKVKSVSLIGNTAGFRNDARVEFVGGGGSGAEATLSQSNCGQVVKLKLNRPGGPFSRAPLVKFVGGHPISTLNAPVPPTEMWLSTKVKFSGAFDHYPQQPNDSLFILAFDRPKERDNYIDVEFGIQAFNVNSQAGTQNYGFVFNVNGIPYTSTPPYMVKLIPGGLLADTYYTIDIHFQLNNTATSLTITPRVNGQTCPPHQVYSGTTPSPSITVDWFYGHDIRKMTNANIWPMQLWDASTVSIDYFNLGTTLGAGDLFSAPFSDTTAPFVYDQHPEQGQIVGGALVLSPSGVNNSVWPTLTYNFTEAEAVVPEKCASPNKKWLLTGSLPTAANGAADGGSHPSITLNDGRVLTTGPGTNAQVYNPVLGTWSAAATMLSPRSNHDVRKLPDGRILIFGGESAQFTPNYTCAIYDPYNNTWVATGSMVATGADDPAAAAGSSGFVNGPAVELAGGYTHSAQLPIKGKILCVRGFREANSTQVYDPKFGTWSVVAPLDMEQGAVYGWIISRLTTLPDGRVLAAFGGWPSASGGGVRQAHYSIFDYNENTWTTAIVPNIAYQSLHSQILLPDGRVFIASGLNDGDNSLLKTLFYDYLTDTWSSQDSDYPARYGRIPILLLDGDVALVGGNHQPSDAATSHTIFRPTSNSFLQGPIGSMAYKHDHASAVRLSNGSVLLISGFQQPNCEILGSSANDATAIYHFGDVWPTLIEEATDPTEGIRTKLIKKIVKVGTPLPEGFAESFPLDIYRSIQIVTKIDLNSVPLPQIFHTSQHVQFPHQLLSIYPLWSQQTSQSQEGSAASGVWVTKVTASAEVNGQIIVRKIAGFTGAALARVERQFFASVAEAEAATVALLPTIIRPSSGTAILKGTSRSATMEGDTANQTIRNSDGTPLMNASGQPARVGDPMANGGILQGIQGHRYQKSSGSNGVTFHVVDVVDVLTPALFGNTAVSLSNFSSAGAQGAWVKVSGTLSLDIPASVPVRLVPGATVLQQVNIEKWRFGIAVRTLVYVEVPGGVNGV